jgi:GNAT superfamily N-acetyltransferase
VPDVRRHGVGRQLQDAQQAWAKDHGYEYIRCECMNHQREFIHFAVFMGYDIVGMRLLPSAVRLNATSRYLGLVAGPAVGAACVVRVVA